MFELSAELEVRRDLPDGATGKATTVWEGIPLAC